MKYFVCFLKKTNSISRIAVIVWNLVSKSTFCLNLTNTALYSLWWNWRSLTSFWTNYNSKVLEAISYEDYHLVNVDLLSIDIDKIKVY